MAAIYQASGQMQDNAIVSLIIINRLAAKLSAIFQHIESVKYL